MSKRMEISNRPSNRRGINISIYLWAEDLEMLDFLAKAMRRSRSEAVRFLLALIRYGMESFLTQKPELIASILQQQKLVHPLIDSKC